jgi:ribosomal protein S18 acetylase RimI-like enzyme
VTTTDTADVTLRPFRHADIPAHTALLAAIEAVDQTGEHYSEADLEEEYANPDIEVGKDIVGAWERSETGEEELVGYFSIYPRHSDDTYQKIHVEGAVRPDRRGQGIGTLLVRGMLERADQVHAEKHPDMPAKLTLVGLSSNEEQARLLTDNGFEAERYSFVMRTMLGEVPEPEPLPAGYRVVRYEESWSKPMHDAHNEAFLDHPNFTQWTEVMWKQWVTDSRNSRPDLSLVVVHEDDPETVVAYIQSNEFDAYFEATGRREAYVAKVGTRRAHRGKGLAGRLLRQALWGYQQAGYEEASLDVDSENPTGALGLYERAGFAMEKRFTDYALTRPPVS